MSIWRFALVCWTSIILGMLPAAEGVLHSEDADAGADAKFFHEQVEPLLQRRCYECHSHATGTMEGDLTLDWRAGWETGGSRGPAIEPGAPDQSLLIQAIRHADPDLRMPEDKLPQEEIDILTQWVARGAHDDRLVQPASEDDEPAEAWWSLRPLVRPAVPASDGQNPIDAFVRERLRREGLAPSGRTDRRTLIRRVTYDLTGLPPTADEVEQFLADRSPAAYEKVVDRLLASPRHGERWARHWLDTIHFADSHGFEHDIGRNWAWRYRDYLIGSLNADTPWARLIREQLAADVFFKDQTELTPALGYLAAGPFDLSAYQTAPVTFDYLDRDDLVTQTMAHFVSTTAGCARCHAHKFDPISQEDYYSLQAVFAGIVKGDVEYDEDPAVAAERQRWNSLIQAAERREAAGLLTAENASLVNAWIEQRGDGPHWRPLEVETFVSTEGATLRRLPDGTILASGTAPERDDYQITAACDGERLTALRLDVLPHESLPSQGPGRCSNGNLHLSAFEVRVFRPGADEGQRIAIESATADFNQQGWGIERAIDGNLTTAWGIHPAVGQAHHAVFQLAEPLTLEAGSRISITLRQQHGGQHLIGAFRLSSTSAPAPLAAAVPEDVQAALGTPAADRSVDQQVTIAAHVLRLRAREQLSSLPPMQIVYAAARNVKIPSGEGGYLPTTLAEPKLVHVLQRGAMDQPGAVATPGALSALQHAPSRFTGEGVRDEAQRRAALADWIAHDDNVLTWRSAVNRIWHYHFGRGICDTPSDFGRMGGQPSHPEMLDYLALWFRDDAAGSLKALHRLIVTSETYCQSSEFRPDAAQADVDNRLLWRQNRHRLDAEAVRDFTRAAAGALDLTMGGPAVQHFHQSKGPQITPVLDYTAYDWAGPDAGRRSIYRYVWRGIPDPFMDALDFPDLGLLAPVRGFSASSLQSLALYNNHFILHHSLLAAQRAEHSSDSLECQVRELVTRIWLREPSEEESRELMQFANAQGLPALCRVLLNSNEFLFIN